MAESNGSDGNAPRGARLYDDTFYQGQIADSYRSATRFVQFLADIFPITSVVDVGCGRGAWLKAFKEAGAQTVVGVDGLWNAQANMIDDSIKFIPADLNRPLDLANEGAFDLAMSLEVAEHLQEASAPPLVRSLTRLSDAVLFGAAYTKQGGKDHINERPNTYWAALFADQRYLPFDLFRPVFWGNADVSFWYQQNTFLYVRKESARFRQLTDRGLLPMSNVAFMDCVHPTLYAVHTTRLKTIVKNALSCLLPSFR